MNSHSDTVTGTTKAGCSISFLQAHSPDFDLYTVDDWKNYITQHLDAAVLSECGRIARDEIAALPPGETQKRMWEAFKAVPCLVGSGGSPAVARLSRELDG